MTNDPKKEWEGDAEFSVLDNNPYYVDGPTYKIKNEVDEILLEGNIPDLPSATDRFICAVEVGKFIARNGVNGCEDNLFKLLDILEGHHRVLLFNQLPREQLEKLMHNSKFKQRIHAKMYF